MELDQFFSSHPDSRQVFDAVYEAARSFGPVQLRVSKSQVALLDGAPPGIGKAFAWLWIPSMYLHRATVPLVLTLSFRERRPWARWKEIYEAAPGRFTHHLELWTPEEVDDDVRRWLREAWPLK